MAPEEIIAEQLNLPYWGAYTKLWKSQEIIKALRRSGYTISHAKRGPSKYERLKAGLVKCLTFLSLKKS